MLLAARRLAYRIVNPKIVHDRIEIKKDSTLPLVHWQLTLVPNFRDEINKNRHNGTQQTR